MYVQKKPLEREIKFTEIYKQNKNENKALREARCLEFQIKNYFVSPRECDLIAGRINRPYLTFSPCIEGDGIDKIAYGINAKKISSIISEMDENSFDSNYIQQCKSVIDYWKAENTNTKIRNKFPKDWKDSIGEDDYKNDNAVMHPIYRLAGALLDFKKLFEKGLNGLILDCENYLKHSTEEKKCFYNAMIIVLSAMKDVISQYIIEAESLKSKCNDVNRIKELEKMILSLKNIKEYPPQSLQEAAQLQVIYMLSGRHVEFGRMDDYYWKFYVNDLSKGIITHDEAIKLFNNLFNIINEECGRDTRVIIGGLGRSNIKSADIFSDFILDVTATRPDRMYPQVSLRIYQGMDEKIYKKALDILSTGMTFPILYNDDVNIPSVMRAMDVPRKIAQQYGFFGCGEFMLAQKSIGTPNTTINLAKALEVTLNGGYNLSNGKLTSKTATKITDDMSFSELLNLYKENLSHYAKIAGEFQELCYDVCSEQCSFLINSCLYDGCLEKGLGVLEGGIYHLGGTTETYGNVTAYDSLTAIKKVVFEDKKITLTQLVKILNNNFVGYEKEQKLLKAAPKFGNDDDYADDIAVEIHEHICNEIRKARNYTRLDSFLVVVINNSMNVPLGKFVLATADGRLSGEYLSNGNTPYSGADKEGITAMMKSMLKMDTSIHACANQNIKLSATMFRENRKLSENILNTFFSLGGQQINLSVVNQKDLEEAMIHPEKHENLLVRVGGFTAKFIRLEKNIQRDILSRTAY